LEAVLIKGGIWLRGDFSNFLAAIIAYCAVFKGEMSFLSDFAFEGN
jgi:hypothetical protein